jgi:hypothetical protein
MSTAPRPAASDGIAGETTADTRGNRKDRLPSPLDEAMRIEPAWSPVLFGFAVLVFAIVVATYIAL